MDELHQAWKAVTQAEYMEKREAGLLASEQKQKEFLDAVAEELSARRDEWRNLQVSVVAGA